MNYLAREVAKYTYNIPHIVNQWSQNLNQITDNDLEDLETFIKQSRFQKSHTLVYSCSEKSHADVTNLSNLQVNDNIWVILKDISPESFRVNEISLKVHEIVASNDIRVKLWDLEGWFSVSFLYESAYAPGELVYRALNGTIKVDRIYKCLEPHYLTADQIKYHDIDLDKL